MHVRLLCAKGRVIKVPSGKTWVLWYRIPRKDGFLISYTLVYIMENTDITDASALDELDRSLGQDVTCPMSASRWLGLQPFYQQEYVVSSYVLVLLVGPFTQTRYCLCMPKKRMHSFLGRNEKNRDIFWNGGSGWPTDQDPTHKNGRPLQTSRCPGVPSDSFIDK